ncbi:hypothetical protein GBF38_008821 [Nibea albiflora]|uniref:Uncharacterized protein n=1 Tax=Nibea albiflora TaxID=240163 RepID=A0ACB7ER70_NIBAL|nr:hypothetical protein GBF38_008821 [Nibea albiflora]
MWRETEEKPEFSLTKAVEDVGQHSYTQTQALKEKEKTLSSLQAALSNVEKKAETAEQELRSKVVEILILKGVLDHQEQQSKVLQHNYSSLWTGITKLQMSVTKEEEDACTALVGFSAYREKMEAHRAAVLQAASQTEAHKQLQETRALVRMLTQKREELREDLEKADGNTVLMAKREIDDLKEEISVMRMTTTERRERLQKEFETHTQMKKEIEARQREIQNRRYEAIVKRLHCQLSRAQAVHRQTSEDIHHMERELAELRKQLESSQDSRGAGYVPASLCFGVGLVLEISKGWRSAAAVAAVARASEKCDFGWRTNEDTDLLHTEAELGGCLLFLIS